ncbi:uncharacterized protein N7515_009606 [Penicillium bovifimosum]|uniref:Ankyrin n=1 Tax=Penicillium bovifimosum TaxID=126998 RepID=A0A9W9GJX2_9EURO|nr:uncharacterized protein N7515_009606 [Penicillium bovifimosum]KAJ5121645.1 hypothetical protein N7515_009606 [Penicillium bovifimosum]
MASKGGLLGQQLEKLIESVLSVARSREQPVLASKWQCIKNCLKWGLNPNYVFEDGMSLMAQAIVKSTVNPYKQHREVKILLAHGADTGCLTSLPDKDSMLHLACLYYQPKIVQELLEKGADPNLRDAQNRTPIHRLFDRHELKSRDRNYLLDILLKDPNVRIDERDGNGRTPLSLVAGHSVNLSMARKFVSRVVYLPERVDLNSQDNEGKSPLCHAISTRDCYMVRQFVSQDRLDPNLGPADAFPLLLAVDFDKLAVLEILLDSRQLDLNKQTSEGETALLRAIHIGNREAVKLLARAGVNPDIESREGEETAREAALNAGILVSRLVGWKRPRLN